MSSQPVEADWLRMFQQPLKTTETFDRQRCLDFLEQKRQVKVAELFGNQSFKTIMASQENVNCLASYKHADIENLLTDMPPTKRSMLKHLVFEIIVLVRLVDSVSTGFLDKESFKNQETIGACSRLDINIRILGDKLSVQQKAVTRNLGVKPIDQAIQKQCQEYVNEITRLEESVVKLENLPKTDLVEKQICAHVARIDELLLFLYQEKSLQNMELSEEQRAFLGPKFAGDSDETNEGLPSSTIALLRTRKVIELANSSVTKLLVHSPPFSGKTSMATLLQYYLTIVKGQTVINIRSSLIPKECTFLDFLARIVLCQHPKVKLSDDDRPEKIFQLFYDLLIKTNVYFIIDDAQRIYGIESFWSMIKAEISKRMICFSSYSISNVGSCSTPLMFDRIYPISFLLFTRDEYENLASNFTILNKKKTAYHVSACNAEERIIKHKEEIYRLTSGYPGLASRGLRLITIEYINENFNRYELYEQLSRPGNARCFKDIKTIEDQAISRLSIHDEPSIQASKLMIRKCLDALITFRHLTEHNLINHVIENFEAQNLLNKTLFELCKDFIEILIRMCVVYQNEDLTLQFATPLFEFFYMKQLSTTGSTTRPIQYLFMALF